MPLQMGDECGCGREYAEMEKGRPSGSLPLGTTLENGKYIIGAVLGKGGFGITYIGYHTIRKSRVAIKEYFPSEFVHRAQRPPNPNEVISTSNYYERFLEKFKSEANIMTQFDYLPNIVRVYDLCIDNNTAYIIMKYIDGQSLKALLDSRGGRISWPELQKIIDPILSALQSIHTAEPHIIHRDISPDNIMIDSNGIPVLIDFGAARIGQKTGGTVAVGKEGYAPIEQVEGDDSQDVRTDVYAIGATMYKALTGITPDSSQMRAIQDKLEPIHVVAPDVPRYVSDAVAKAMSIRIDQRWNSAEEFRNVLNNASRIQPRYQEQQVPPIFPEEQPVPPVNRNYSRSHELKPEYRPGPEYTAEPVPAYNAGKRQEISRPLAQNEVSRVQPENRKQAVTPKAEQPKPAPKPKPQGKQKQKKQSRSRRKISFGRVMLLIFLILAAILLCGFITASLLFPDNISLFRTFIQSEVLFDPAAKVTLGRAYRDGDGPKQDLEKAGTLFKGAADDGDPDGEYELALCHYYGTCAGSNLYNYVFYMEASARHGNEEARLSLVDFYTNGIPGVRGPNPEEAKKWAEFVPEEYDPPKMTFSGWLEHLFHK